MRKSGFTSTAARIIAVLALVVASFCLTSAGIASGQTITPDDVERLLVPICPANGQPGRFGAFWLCELWVRNSANVPVVFSRGGPVSSLPDGGLIQITPNVTEFYPGSATRGAIYIVGKSHANEVHMSLRIADVNRRPVSVGTEIPIVRERDWLSAPVELLDVPTEVFVRQTLRVYDADARKGEVRLTIYPLTENEPVATTVIPLRGGSNRALEPVWYVFPDYAEISDIVEAFPRVAAHPRLRLRLEPLTPGMRYWAFVTVTDNMTQQVSVITPR